MTRNFCDVCGDEIKNRPLPLTEIKTDEFHRKLHDEITREIQICIYPYAKEKYKSNDRISLEICNKCTLEFINKYLKP